jgi:PAS domain S-box-containing protein
MDVDYRLAFELAPVGLCLSRNRSIVDCNRQLCEMFGFAREVLIGQSFMTLYPSPDEYERLGARMAPILNARGHYADDRIMKRANGEVFWSFEDLSSQRPVKAELTAREREVAARLLEGMTSKEIGKALDISHRTVEIYRARLMRKYKANTTADLVHKLTAGQ